MKDKKLYWKEIVSQARVDIEVPDGQLYYTITVIKKFFQDHTLHVIKHDSRIGCRGVDVYGYWSDKIYSMRGGKMAGNIVGKKILSGEIR